MAVVVNEFEVMPAAEPERAPAGDRQEHHGQADVDSDDFRLGVERALCRRHERLERLRAD
jgi:hypothetical protein